MIYDTFYYVSRSGIFGGNVNKVCGLCLLSKVRIALPKGESDGGGFEKKTTPLEYCFFSFFFFSEKIKFQKCVYMAAFLTPKTPQNVYIW
jgi:hypothetical protein